MTTSNNDIPTKVENKILENLFLAVYFNDLEKIVEFKNKYPEIYAKKNKFLIDEHTTFDLMNLTFFNQTIWFDNSWRKEIIPLVEKNRMRIIQVLDYWRSEFGLQNIKRQIEYSQYCDFFYCNYYSDSYEEWKKNELRHIEIEFREIDLMLMYQVERFNFAETKKLLEQGAKSDIDFYDDNFSSVNSRIGTESSFLATTFVVPEFEIFEIKGYNQDFDIKDMFSRLLGFAAHEEMYHLLRRYELNR